MTTKPQESVEWAPEQSVTERAQASRRINVEGLLAQLQDAPMKWAVYSTHKTRGAARQRVYALRNAASYKGQPLEWATAKVEPGEKGSPVQVLVRWNEDLPPREDNAPVADADADTQNEG